MKEFLQVLKDLNDFRYTFSFWYENSLIIFRVSYVDIYNDIRIGSERPVTPEFMENMQTDVLISVLKDLTQKVKLKKIEIELTRE